MRIRIKVAEEYSAQVQAILRQQDQEKTEETLYHYKIKLNKTSISNLDYQWMEVLEQPKWPYPLKVCFPVSHLLVEYHQPVASMIDFLCQLNWL